VDQEADYDIPQRVWENWIPSAGPRAIVRGLTAQEREIVQLRANELAFALRPLSDRERERADAALSAMLGGFRSMRQFGENVEATVQVLLHALREFPAWAIVEACDRIRRRQVELDPRFAPNDPQIYEIVAAIVAPYRRTLHNAQTLLTAPIAPRPHPKPSREEVERVLSHPLSGRSDKLVPPIPRDGKHAQRVTADIEARKATRIQQEQSGLCCNGTIAEHVVE
jgi:hypothetical protein